MRSKQLVRTNFDTRIDDQPTQGSLEVYGYACMGQRILNLKTAISGHFGKVRRALNGLNAIEHKICKGLAGANQRNFFSKDEAKETTTPSKSTELNRQSTKFLSVSSCSHVRLTKPRLLLLLPSILFLVFSIGMERLGRWPVPVESKGCERLLRGKLLECVMTNSFHQRCWLWTLHANV